MAVTDERDVRKLSRFLETHRAYSPDTRKSFSSKTSGGSAYSGTYTSDDFSYEYRGVVAVEGASMNNGPLRPDYEGSTVNCNQTIPSRVVLDEVPSKDERPCVLCKECSKEHPPYSYCPYVPCRVCYKVHHPTNCPYFRRVPQGATFDPRYELVCGCGNVFNEDKWACTFCGGSNPVLKVKYCSICKSSKQHRTHECPNDKVLAAKYKATRDKLLTVGPDMIPYPRVCIPEST